MFINPAETLNQIGLKKEMTAVDFGAGGGGWTLPLAKILEDGFVFAVDILEEPLSALQGKARSSGLNNIRTIISDIEAGVSKISSQSCDFVLITNVLFQVDDKDAAFKETSRVLKPGGRLLVVDWLPEATLGPKEGKVSIQRVKEIAAKAKFQFEKELPAELYHYGLLFVKE
ncbi:MAG: class I SAM-dependent methyltransferase [Candidatus Pacebacteria bacterium]|nr:class I SAM-dependent methyltransferase [Candidatus Paceibacterota bacterium]